MLRPNRTCTVQKRTGRDVYGQEIMGAKFSERCAVVELRHVVSPTTVRADSSSSRGHGDEFITYNKILLTKTTVAKLDDKITVSGLELRIIDLNPQYNINGVLDHYEARCKVWS